MLYFRLIDRAGATNALLVTLMVPPTAILLGALFLNETLAPQDFLGLALIALGLAGDRRTPAQPFWGAAPSAISLAASGLVQTRSPT